MATAGCKMGHGAAGVDGEALCEYNKGGCSVSTKRLREGERRMQEGAQGAREAQHKHSNECIKAQGGCREGRGWPERHGMSTTRVGEGVGKVCVGAWVARETQHNCNKTVGGCGEGDM